jgi:hypothetical protein
MSSQVKVREVALLLLPVAVLVAVGAVLRGRPSPVATPELKVSDIRFRRLPGSGSEQSGQIGMKVYVRYSGNGLKGLPDRGFVILQNMRFVSGRGKELPLNSFGGGPIYSDEGPQTYALDYTGSIPKGHDITKPGYFKGTAVLSTNARPPKRIDTAPFSWPVQLR